MNEQPKLSQRLTAAADMVRTGAVVADVGTDHAYVPIALCLSGRAIRAIASDVAGIVGTIDGAVYDSGAVKRRGGFLRRALG